MDEFENLLEAHRIQVERFVRIKIGSKSDADDVIQEVYLAAYRDFPKLKNKDSFKPWIVGIARHKCNDYFRRKSAQYEIPIDELNQNQLSYDIRGISEISTVRETLSLLGDRDKQILYLYFWKELPQAEIAKRLNIPVGTVKSRLHTAKRNFKDRYPYHSEAPKGENSMKKLPEFIPEYKIEDSGKPPFAVKWEEVMGWFIVPKLGERLTWGMYDIPSRKCDRIFDLNVTGKAKVHGIEGVELTAHEESCTDKSDVTDWTFVAQLTDTHCRYLAAMYNDGDVNNYTTFLDGDDFLPNWGFGEDNCGNETNLTPKGDIKRNGDIVSCVDKEFLLDVVGRYTVTIGTKTYDTVCVMYIDGGVVSEQFIDKNGKTILWRRFNRDDWAIKRYKRKWSEQLPENDRLYVNSETYVHWYDCITDYIL